jgi:hypothetical protein
MAWAVLVIVAWGCLAFGAVYPWAYWGLLGACALVGIWGLVRPVPRVRRRVVGPVAAGLVLVALAIGAQLIPLSRNTLLQISPSTDEVLRNYNLQYAVQVTLNQQATARGLLPLPGTTASTLAESEARAATTEIRHPLSINPSQTQLGLIFVLALGIFLLGLARGLDGYALRNFAPGLVVLGVLMSIIAIVQKALWNGKVYGFWVTINPDTTAFGPFVNRNHFAGWMLLALPVAIGLFASQIAKGMRGVKPGWRQKLLWFATPDANRAILTGFSILVMGLALVMTLSRSGITCFMVALLVGAFQVMRRQATRNKRNWLVAYFVLVAVVSVGWAGLDAIAARFAQVDSELGGRVGAWNDAWRIHNLFPMYGTGFNTYGTATLFYQQHDVASHYVEAHSDYLQLLAEGGYLVALPAVLLIGCFARQVYRRFEEGHDDRVGYWLRLGAVTGIVAIALQEIVEFSLQMPGNAALFVVLCAIAMRKSSTGGTR